MSAFSVPLRFFLFWILIIVKYSNSLTIVWACCFFNMDNAIEVLNKLLSKLDLSDNFRMPFKEECNSTHTVIISSTFNCRFLCLYKTLLEMYSVLGGHKFSIFTLLKFLLAQRPYQILTCLIFSKWNHFVWECNEPKKTVNVGFGLVRRVWWVVFESTFKI